MSQTVACPHCNAGLILSPAVANRIVTCPRCKQQVQMPPAESPPVVEAELAPEVNDSTFAAGFPGIKTGGSQGSAAYRKPAGLPVWIGAIGVLGLCIIICCGALNGVRQAGSGGLTKNDFRGLEGKTEKEVIQAVGRPSSASEDFYRGPIWFYWGVYDPVTGKSGGRVSLLFQDGIVIEVRM